jgi:hypothetical protein
MSWSADPIRPKGTPLSFSGFRDSQESNRKTQPLKSTPRSTGYSFRWFATAEAKFDPFGGIALVAGGSAIKFGLMRNEPN